MAAGVSDELKLTLYSYFRSSAAYRVRIALALKGLAYETVPVHLVKDGGQQRSDWYRKVNPQMRVPALVVEQAERTDTLIQSPAILEWLDETFAEPPLLPRDPLARARCRAIGAIVGCDVHPLNNSGTLKALTERFEASERQRMAWYAKWIQEGFAAIEALVEGGGFACGDAPTLADVYLVPQVANARRFDVDISAFPKIVAIDANCRALPAFQAAAPERQPDAE